MPKRKIICTTPVKKKTKEMPDMGNTVTNTQSV